VKGGSAEAKQKGGELKMTPLGVLKYSLDGLGAESPGIGTEAEGLVSSMTSTPGAMLIIGGILILGGAVWLAISKLAAWKQGGILIVVGGGLMTGAYVYEKYPLAAVGIFLVAVGGIAYLIVQQLRLAKTQKEKDQAIEGKRQVDETLSLVARAVEEVQKVDDTAAAKVKAKVEELAGKFKEAVKDVINKAKTRAGL